jgi:hypothetical protein
VRTSPLVHQPESDGLVSEKDTEQDTVHEMNEDKHTELNMLDVPTDTVEMLDYLQGVDYDQ